MCPSIRHTTWTSWLSQSSSHTVPHCPYIKTSTLPYVELPLTKRTLAVSKDKCYIIQFWFFGFLKFLTSEAWQTLPLVGLSNLEVNFVSFAETSESCIWIDGTLLLRTSFFLVNISTSPVIFTKIFSLLARISFNVETWSVKILTSWPFWKWSVI